MEQAPLIAPSTRRPPGFVYRPEFLGLEDESELLGIIARAEDYQRSFSENALANGGASKEEPLPRGPEGRQDEQ